MTQSKKHISPVVFFLEGIDSDSRNYTEYENNLITALISKGMEEEEAIKLMGLSVVDDFVYNNLFTKNVSVDKAVDIVMKNIQGEIDTEFDTLDSYSSYIEADLVGEFGLDEIEAKKLISRHTSKIENYFKSKTPIDKATRIIYSGI